jgi:hypothetical protein
MKEMNYDKLHGNVLEGTHSHQINLQKLQNATLQVQGTASI